MRVYGISTGFSLSRLGGAASYFVVIFLGAVSIGGDVASISEYFFVQNLFSYNFI